MVVAVDDMVVLLLAVRSCLIIRLFPVLLVCFVLCRFVLFACFARLLDCLLDCLLVSL